MKIIVQEECDCLSIVVDDKRFRYHHEDNKSEMVELFKYLGFDDVTYEEVY